MSSKLSKYNHKIFSQCFVRSCAIILKYSLNIKNQKGIKNCTVFFSRLIKYSWCIVSLGYLLSIKPGFGSDKRNRKQF